MESICKTCDDICEIASFRKGNRKVDSRDKEGGNGRFSKVDREGIFRGEDTVRTIKAQRFRWYDHVHRGSEESLMKSMFRGRRIRGRIYLVSRLI